MTNPSRPTTATIDDLRAEVDAINRELLTLISRRGEVVAQIGHAKSSEGRPQHYDPAREEQQLKVLEGLNPGPFSNAAIKTMFKEIFKASLALEESNDKKALLFSRKVKAEDTVLDIDGVKIGGGQPPIVIAGPCSIESEEQMEQAADLAPLARELAAGKLTTRVARDALARAAASGEAPLSIIEREGLNAGLSAEALQKAVQDVLAANPAETEAYRSGKTALMGFFTGQVMRATGGKAEPKAVAEALKAALA